jgi:hypothetical protein
MAARSTVTATATTLALLLPNPSLSATEDYLEPAVAVRVTPATGFVDLLGINLSYAPAHWFLQVGVGHLPSFNSSMRIHLGACPYARVQEKGDGRGRRLSIGLYGGPSLQWYPRYQAYHGNITLEGSPLPPFRSIDKDWGMDFGLQGTLFTWRASRLAVTGGLRAGGTAWSDWGVLPDLRLDVGLAWRLPKR